MCGNCNTERLQNAKECYCCREIEKAVQFIEELDSHDKKSVDKVICVTNHPGFPAVCLNRWLLELAADMFKTHDGHRYHQIRTKERYVLENLAFCNKFACCIVCPIPKLLALDNLATSNNLFERIKLLHSYSSKSTPSITPNNIHTWNKQCKPNF